MHQPPNTNGVLAAQAMARKAGEIRRQQAQPLAGNVWYAAPKTKWSWDQGRNVNVVKYCATDGCHEPTVKGARKNCKVCATQDWIPVHHGPKPETQQQINDQFVINSAAFEAATMQFENFDSNGDGQISFEEMKQGFATLGVPRTDVEIRELIAEHDVIEKDGQISFNEFLTVMGAAPKQPQTQPSGALSLQ